MPQLFKRMPRACSEWCHGFRQDLNTLMLVLLLVVLLALVFYGCYVRRREPGGVATFAYVRTPHRLYEGRYLLLINDPYYV